MVSFRTTVQELEQALVPSLCTPANFEQILKAADQLPPVWLGMLEAHFEEDNPTPWLDFFGLIYKGKGDFEKVVDFYANGRTPSPDWQRRLDWINQASQGSTFLGQHLNRIWVSFDLKPDEPPAVWDYLGFSGVPIWPQFRMQLYRNALEGMGREVNSAEFDLLGKIDHLISPHHFIDNLGWPPFREDNRIRICLFPFTRYDQTVRIFQAMETIIPPGENQFSALMKHAHHCCLRLESDTGIHSKIGIEFGLDKNNNRSKAQALMGELIDLGILGQEHFRRLMSWISDKEEADMKVERYIDHFKLTYEEGRFKEMKAYLGFSGLNHELLTTNYIDQWKMKPWKKH